MEQLSFTLYFYSAAFYSIGAFLARKTSSLGSHKLQSWGVMAIGLLILAPYIVSVISSIVLAILNFDMFKDELNALRESFRAVNIIWWGPVISGLLIGFPAAMGGFLIRSAVKMRRES